VAPAFAAIAGFVAAVTIFGGCSAKPAPFSRERALEMARKDHADASLPADTVPAGVTVRENIAYASRGGRSLELDVYAPAKTGPHPAVLVVHGGGWQSGQRQMERPFAKRLAALGYVTITVSYRLGPEGRYPHALHDLKAAVRWLRRNAALYSIDPERMAAVGGSAGGQLVALLGTTNGMPRFEGDQNGEATRESSRVQAVVNIDGLVDFTARALLDKEAHEPGGPTNFLGGPFATRSATWREASPITHAGPESPPMLFIESGVARPILPGRPEMCAKLQRAGVVCQRELMPRAPHPFWLLDPWFEPTLRRTERFLRDQVSRTP
jgi:acetyl esterase/lipase